MSKAVGVVGAAVGLHNLIPRLFIFVTDCLRLGLTCNRIDLWDAPAAAEVVHTALALALPIET